MIRLKNKVIDYYKKHSIGITITIVCVLSGWFIINGLMQTPAINANRKAEEETRAKIEEEKAKLRLMFINYYLRKKLLIIQMLNYIN